jgi:hypothetical protein
MKLKVSEWKISYWKNTKDPVDRKKFIMIKDSILAIIHQDYRGEKLDRGYLFEELTDSILYSDDISDEFLRYGDTEKFEESQKTNKVTLETLEYQLLVNLELYIPSSIKISDTVKAYERTLENRIDFARIELEKNYKSSNEYLSQIETIFK